MKRSYFQFIFAFLFLFSIHTNAQSTETFEVPLPLGSTTWTRAGLTFSTSSGNFNSEEFVNAGAGGSDRFLDNINAPATNSTYSVSITGGATLFTMESMELYLSSSATGNVPTNDGSVTIKGLAGGSQVFTYTKAGGFPTSLVGADNGFFLVDFTGLPGVGDVTSMNIDELEITINGAFQYLSLDNFEFDNQVLNTDPPEVQSIAVIGVPNSTATSVDFLVTFNEDALMVDTSDFSLDTTGTFGTISGISGSGTAYIVTVSGISGEGTISIDLISGNDIEDALGNSPVAAFTSGEDHIVSRCFQENFESFLANDFSFSSNGVTFTTSTANFSIEFFNNGGAGGSDQFLSNTGDQGTGKVYNITTPGTETFTAEAMDFYLSSLVGGTTPTNNGTLTLEGRLSGSTLYTIQKTTGFPTDFSFNNGFFVVDFATEGAADYSLTNIDELRITIGGAFQYIGLDNFEHCEEVTSNLAPIVQNINLIGNPPASSSSVNFEVVFNEDAVNVTSNDFSLTALGTATGTISGVSGSGTTYNVSVNNISGEGSLRLDLNAGTDIEDLDGNTPPDPFIEGERFIASICNVETFEGLADGTFSWTTNTVPWSSGAASFSVDEFINAGAGGSDRYIDNLTSQGINDINTIAITNTQMVKMGSMEIYVSSLSNGTLPTNDGTLTVRGKLDGTTVYTVTKSTGFATVIGSNQGFYLWDFATEGGVDHSMTDIDEIEFEIGGSFQYLAVDNFKSCIDPGIAPIITCPSDITVNNDLGQCGANVTFEATETTADPASTITYDIQPGSFFNAGITIVTATATNTVGTSTCMFNVTVEDNEDPEILNCPTEFTIALDGSGNAESIDLADFTNAGVTYSDNCGIDTVEVSANSFDCSDVAGGNSSGSVWINEFHYDNTSTDVGEFVEVAGTAGFDLTGYTIILYNGSNGTSYGTINLSGSIDDEGNGFGALSFPRSGIQNGGPDGIALIDNIGTVVEFLSYEGAFTATNGPANGATSTNVGVSETSGTAAGDSIQLKGSGSVAGDFSWTAPSTDSPGDLNDGQTITTTTGGLQVTLTVTDVNGNVATCVVPVTVEDNEAPEILNCPTEFTIVIDGSGNAESIDLADFTNAGVTYSDNCGIDTVEVSANSFDCSDIIGGNSSGSVWINEFHYDNTSTDVGEFVEVAGTAGFDLTGYTIILYNGSNGTSYGTINLSGSIDDEGNGFGALSFPRSGIQNGGPDGIALIDNIGTVVEFLSYEGAFTATNGPANGVTSTNVGVSETSGTAAGDSIQLKGSGSVAGDFSWTAPSTDSPGDLNDGQTITTTTGGLQVTLTVTDINGNASTCVVPVTVEDNEEPEILNCPSEFTIVLDASGSPESIDLADFTNAGVTYSDNCGIDTVEVSANSFDCSDVSGGNSSGSIWINEFHYDNASSDVGEFIEVAGTAGFDLTGYSITLYNGSNGTVYNTINLTGSIDDEGNGFGALDFQLPSNGLQNGSPDGLALVDDSGTVIEFISYEGSLNATSGPANGTTSTDIGVSETSATPIGQSLQLSGTGSTGGDFTWSGPSADSPGSLNTGQTITTGGLQVTLTVTDVNGNVSTCTVPIKVEDNQDPEILNCPSEFTIVLDGSGSPESIDLADFTNAGVTYSDNCGIDTVEVSANSFDCSDTTGGSSAGSVWINEFHYDNASSDVGEFIEVAGTAGFDLTGYSITLYNGSNGTVYNTINLTGSIDDEGNGFGALDFQLPSNGLQNGSPDGLALVDDSGTVIEFISYEGSLNATSGPANGTTSTDIGVSETGATPIGQSLQLSGTGSTGGDFTWSGPSADSPGSLNAGQTITTTTGGLQVTLTVTDVNGNVSTCIVPVKVEDNEIPVINDTPTNIVVSNDPGVCNAVVNWTPATVSDNCTGATISSDHQPGDTFPLGETIITYTASDANGNDAIPTTFTVTVEDNEIPEIFDTPTNITVSNDLGNCDTVVSWNLPFVVDNCPNTTISSDHQSGDTFPIGTTTVTYTASDANGNDAIATSFTVTVEDNEDPVAICPADITVSNDSGLCGAIVNFTLGVTDNCPNATVVASPESGTLFDVGTTEVTVTATDATGNTNVCTFNVIVEDNEAPIVDCFDLTITLDDLGNGGIDVAAFIAANGSTDNCEIDTITLSETTFDCSSIGGDLDELIISEYVDGSGNNDWIEIFNGTGNTIVLGDVVNGNLVSYYSINIYSDGSTTPITIGLLGTIGDREAYKISHTDAPNISGNPTTNFGSPLMVFDGNDAIALSNNGVAVDIIGVIGDNPGSGWTSTSNTTNATTLVRSETIQQGNVSTFLTSFESEWIQSTQNNVSNLGDHDIEISDQANNVILTVTDIHGNVATCEGSVTVVDATLPEALCQDVTVQLGADGLGSTTAQAVDNGSNDACGIGSLALSQTQFTCADVNNPVSVTLTVTDTNGNPATCTATVTVLDEVAPDIQCNPITVQLDNSGNYVLTDYTGQGTSDVDNIGAGSNDACGIATMSVSPNNFTCTDVGSPVTVELTVIDNNGNVSTCQTTVTVEDNVAPEALCQPATVQLDANGEASITIADIDNGSNDACGIASRSLDITDFTCADVGSPVTVELTVTDNNGNVSTCEALVTVLGDLPTVTINDPEELPEFCQGAVLVLTTNATNAASYLWSPGGETTDSIEVGPQGGTFTVTITSATNCTATATYTVAPFDASTLLSSYTILAEDEVFLHGSNLVQSGGIGATDTNGLIKLHQASTVVEFGRAANIVLNQGSTIVNPIFQPANIPFPSFVTNTLSNNTSPNVTINNNQSTTLNGSVYGTVTVKQGATVTFSESNIYIDELKTFDGASIEFLGCANVFINDKFMLAQNGTINANANNVVMYINEDVQIEKGSYVRARIHSNGNELLAKGPNGNGNNSGNTTQMIGLFIAKKVHGNKNVIWNADEVCSPCSVSNPLPPINGNGFNNNFDVFDVVSWPNPSETVFNLKLNTKDLSSKSQINVFDISNKLVYRGKFMPDEVYVFGKELEAGVYIVKIQQGQNSKTIRLVKY